MSLSKLWEIVKDGEVCHPAIHGGHKESDMTERLKNNKGCMVKIKTSLEDLNSLQIFVKSPNFSSHL